MRDVQRKKRNKKQVFATIRRHFGASFSLSNGTIKAKLCVCRLVAAKKELNWIEQKVVVSCANKQEQKKFPPFLWAKRSKPLKLEACSLRENTMHTNTPTASQSIRFQFSEEFGRHQHKRGIRVRTSGRKECADWEEIVALTAPKYRSQRIEPSSRKIVKKKEKSRIAKLALPDSLFLSGVCSLSVCLSVCSHR